MLTNLARKWGTRVVQPIARLLIRLGATPNLITVLGFALTVGVSVVMAAGYTRLSAPLLVFALGFDSLDGTVARLTGTETRFGAFLDSTLDRWAEIAIYLALAWFFVHSGQENNALLAALAMATSLMVSYTRARAEGIGVPLREGVLTRLERMVILIAGLLFNVLTWALWIIAVFAGVTAVQRILATRRLTQSGQHTS